MMESAVLFGKDHSLVGILTEGKAIDGTAARKSEAILLLNSGLIHHVGPNRLYVKIARRFAAEGFWAFRFDFSGIGDSGVRMDKMPAAESIIDEARRAMDYLQETKGINNFILIGNCSGAENASMILAADTRVTKAVLINPPVPEATEADNMKSFSYYWKSALYNPASWLRFFFMRSNYKTIRSSLWLQLKSRISPGSIRGSIDSCCTSEVNRFFENLHARGVHLLVIFSEAESGSEQYFRMTLGKCFVSMKECGLLQTEFLDGADHSITPLRCQERLMAMISQWLSNCECSMHSKSS